MSRKKSKSRKSLSENQNAFSANPFADLTFPEGAVQEERQSKAPADIADARSGDAGRRWMKTAVYIRLSKKGRAGKVVTVLTFDADSPPDEVRAIARRLQRSLGTGGSCNRDTVELQGDQRSTSAAWLRQEGFRLKGEI